VRIGRGRETGRTRPLTCWERPGRRERAAVGFFCPGAGETPGDYTDVDGLMLDLPVLVVYGGSSGMARRARLA